jgi:hypothetical protein
VGLLLATAAVPARAQCDTTAGRALDVAGQVIDARALVPLRASLVLTAGRDTLAALDADSLGNFSTSICRRPSVVAHFRRLGYRADSVTLVFDSTRWMPLDVAMSPLRDGVTLATTRVTAPRTLSAVETRVKRSGGVYVGLEEIERIKPVRTSDLFRSRRGIKLEDVNGEMRLVSSRGSRPGITDVNARMEPPMLPPRADSAARAAMETPTPPKTGVESCPLRIAVNGHLMPEEYTLDEVAVTDIVALEIYSGVAAMPIQFSSTRHGMNCGLAMIWTRSVLTER